jgi:hypothetical protein
MPAPMIDRALATARSLAAALPLATEKGRDHHTGREFDFVPARELVRAAAVVLPQASLSLRARGESVSQWGLTVTYRLTHADGDFDEWTSVTPLSQAVRPELAIDWARTASLKAAIRGLLWIGAAESPDPCETGQPKLAESRTQRQVQEDERREKKGLEPYHRNGSGRSTKASRATAALADAMSESPVAVELGDEEREKEAAMDLEAKRLAALPSSLPLVKDPDWLEEDEPKAQAHQKPDAFECCSCWRVGTAAEMRRTEAGHAWICRDCDACVARIQARIGGGPDQPASPPVATPSGSLDGDEGEVTPVSPSVLTGGALHNDARAAEPRSAQADGTVARDPIPPDAATPASSPLPEQSSSPALSGDIKSPSVLVVRNNQGGLPPGAPLGGECGAVVEPPASGDCPSGAGAPPAHECTCSANLLMLTGLVHQDGCPYAKAPAPASDEEDPDAWRSRVSPEVAARYDAADAAEAASLRERVEALGYVLHADGTKGRMRVTEPTTGTVHRIHLNDAKPGDVEAWIREREGELRRADFLAHQGGMGGPLSAPSEEQVNVVSNVATSAVSIEALQATAKDLLARFKKAHRAKDDKGTCLLCGERIEGGDFYRGPRFGAAHEDCITEVQAGRDPKCDDLFEEGAGEEAEVSA